MIQFRASQGWIIKHPFSVLCTSEVPLDSKKAISYYILNLRTGSDNALTELQKWVDMMEGFNVKDMEPFGILFVYFCY